MNNKALLTEIVKITNVLDLHITRLKNKPESVHEIDIDILAEKLKDIYSKVLELETEVSIREIIDENILVQPEPEPTLRSEPEQADKVAKDPEPEPEPEIIAENEAGPEPEIIIEKEIISEPEIISEKETEPEMVAVYEAEPERDSDLDPVIPHGIKPHVEEQPEEEETAMPHSRTTADLFSGPPTIADTFQSREDRTIAARAVPHGVDDLKRAIGINDKFLFINELFKGSPGEYNQAIEKLNTAGELGVAQHAIDQYRSQYDWADQSEAYNRLKKIVYAKFNGS